MADACMTAGADPARQCIGAKALTVARKDVWDLEGKRGTWMGNVGLGSKT